MKTFQTNIINPISNITPAINDPIINIQYVQRPPTQTFK